MMNTLQFVSVIIVLDIVSSRYGRHDYVQATSNDPEDAFQNGGQEHNQDFVKVEPMPSINIGQLFRLLKSFKDKTLFNRILNTDDNIIYNVHRYRRIRGFPNWG